MYSIKIQVRANLKGTHIYIEDDLVANRVSAKEPKAINIAISKALGDFISQGTIYNLTQFTMSKLPECTNIERYKQIVEQNINGCLIRIFIKKME